MNTNDVLAIPNRGFPLLVGDVEGLFMHSHRVAAEYLAKRLGGVRILEICCGVGAITAALSKQAQYVFAVDSDPLRIKCAEINVQTYGDPHKVKLQATDALAQTLWLEAKPDVVVADPDWAKHGDLKSAHTSDLAMTQPPVPEILDMAHSLGIPGVVIRLSPVSDVSSLTKWEPFELEKVSVDTSDKYWFAYFGSVCTKPGVSADLKLFNE